MHIGIAVLLELILKTGILCAIAYGIVWFIDWIGVIPAPLAKIIKIVVVAIIGVYIIIMWLGFAGIS